MRSTISIWWFVATLATASLFLFSREPIAGGMAVLVGILTLIAIFSHKNPTSKKTDNKKTNKGTPEETAAGRPNHLVRTRDIDL